MKKRIYIVLLIVLLIFVGISLATDINKKPKKNNNVISKENVTNKQNVSVIENDIVTDDNDLTENNAISDVNEIDEDDTNEKNVTEIINNEEINENELQSYATNQEKAIAIVKRQWGEDNVNSFSCYEHNRLYIVEIRKPDTTLWCTYTVNVETEECYGESAETLQ